MVPMHDILIVGYGPAGATLAKLLGQRGYDVVVVDSATAVYDKPRAITADQEVMRVFQECGLAEAISAGTSPHPGTDFVGLQGQVIKRFYPQPGPQQLAWEPTWMFVQPELEARLREGVAQHPNVRVLLGHECVELAQDADSVAATVRDLAQGEEQVLRARYVVGCDGARSMVRRQMGAAIEDLAFDEWWIVVDAWLRRPTPLPERCRQYCQPDRPGTFMIGPGMLRRWEIKLLPGETAADFEDPAAIRRVLSRFVDVDALDLCRSATYRFHALVARQWRFGRVFLMGDAAHQTPPFLGQGLCAAIRDTINFTWKFDAVMRLGATPELLDSYGEERTPHVRTVVAHAKAFGLIIGELDEAAARERDERLEAELRSGRAETVRQKFIPGLSTGVLDRDADGRPVGGAGTLELQPWVQPAGDAGAQWRRLDDCLPAGFRLLGDDPAVLGWLDADRAAFWQRLGGRAVLIGDQALPAGVSALALRERDTVFADWLAGLGARVALVRPDHYVYGTARDAAGLCRLLDRLRETLFPGLPGPMTADGPRATASA